MFDSLVWSDEFDGVGAIDSTKWFHQTQLPPGGSWWGGLIQHYTDRVENTYLSDGFLNMVAKNETFDDQGEVKEYTSARLKFKVCLYLRTVGSTCQAARWRGYLACDLDVKQEYQ